MNPGDLGVLIRGAGELASATAHHLYSQGFERILLLDRRFPKAVRRKVCFCEAILDRTQTIQDVVGRFTPDLAAVEAAHARGEIAVGIMDHETVLDEWHPDVFIEAAMQRRNWGLTRDLAPIVIALGPGYIAHKDCDALVDTVRGPQVGSILEDTGEHLANAPPAEIMGFSEERTLKALRDGIFFTQHTIGDMVERGERIGTVVSVYGVDDYRRGVPVDASYSINARIGGVIRGLLRDGVPVKANDRIGDVDPRGTTDDLDHVSDKSHRVAEGVHEALLALVAEMNTSKWRAGPGNRSVV